MKEISLMKNEIEFSQATEQDVSEIYSMMERAKAHSFEQGIYQWTETYPTYNMIYGDIKNSYTETIKIKGKIIGFFTSNSICEDDVHNHIHWLNENNWIILHRLCIDPPFQNKGLWTMVLRKFEERSLSRGYNSIRIDVFSTNLQAIHIYEKFGYTRLGYAFCDRGKFYIYEKLIK